MLLKIVRSLTPEEIAERIRRFETEFGVGFEEFKERYLGQRLDAKLTRSYFEWADLVDSYRGYVEDGELDFTIEEVVDLEPEKAALLTPRRVELLYQLASLRVESISDLAQKVRRDVKNVYQDLQVLSGLGFVKLSRRKGKALVPETLVKEITFLVR
jgi:DNA-binding transcriptional ArsR family regulator